MLHNLTTMLIFCAMIPPLAALYLLQASILISPRSLVGSPGMLEGISRQKPSSLRRVFDRSAWDPPIDVRVERQHGSPRSLLGRHRGQAIAVLAGLCVETEDLAAFFMDLRRLCSMLDLTGMRWFAPLSFLRVLKDANVDLQSVEDLEMAAYLKFR